MIIEGVKIEGSKINSFSSPTQIGTIEYWFKKGEGLTTTTNGANEEVNSWEDVVGGFTAVATAGIEPYSIEAGIDFRSGSRLQISQDRSNFTKYHNSNTTIVVRVRIDDFDISNIIIATDRNATGFTIQHRGGLNPNNQNVFFYQALNAGITMWEVISPPYTASKYPVSFGEGEFGVLFFELNQASLENRIYHNGIFVNEAPKTSSTSALPRYSPTFGGRDNSTSFGSLIISDVLFYGSLLTASEKLDLVSFLSS